jgi:hypothetical protein
MKPLSKITIEVDNDDLADLYNIIDENKTYYRSGSVERRMIESWQTKWSDVYQKHGNFYLVFDEEDLTTLFSMMQYISPHRYSTNSSRRTVSEMLLEFLQDHSS